MTWIHWRVAPLRMCGRWPGFEGWDQGNIPRIQLTAQFTGNLIQGSFKACAQSQ